MRAAVARKRARWRTLRRRLDPDRLVFVDETWIKTNVAPLRGWAPKGHRLTGFAPHGRWRTLTFLAALRRDGSVDLIYLDPPFNSNRDYAAPIGSEAAGAAFKTRGRLAT